MPVPAAPKAPVHRRRLAEPEVLAQALTERFASRADRHDREASFPHDNVADLHESGLLGFAVPVGWGGHGASLPRQAAVVGAVAQGDASTGLVLAMHYLQTGLVSRSVRWPAALAERVARDAVESGALVNALRVEPALGTPARGGLPETTIRRTPDGWSLSGRKIYSTGSPALSWYLVWARTDEAEPRVGIVLVPAGLPGTRIEETWDHLGLRASGSHDVVFEDVAIPAGHAVDLRPPAEWARPDPVQTTTLAVLLSAVYDGVARAALDWTAGFLKTRAPANLGAPLSSLPRVQEAVGRARALLFVNERLIASLAEAVPEALAPDEPGLLKATVTNNAVAVVEECLKLTGNPGLSRANPLERHHRDVLCGRVHTPQDDTVHVAAGRALLG